MNKIHFIGYSAVHPEDFIYEFPLTDSYLLLLTSTPARFWVDDELREYPAHSAILYEPGQKVYYSANGEPYGNDWIRFASDERFVTNFPVKGIPFPVTDYEYCHNLFQLLTWEDSFSLSDNELVTSNLLQVLLLRLRDDFSQKQPDPQRSNLLLLRKSILNNPQLDWNVDKMAGKLHISAGHLQLIYKRAFGISCMDDVINGRIRMAKERLTYTPHTIQEIADTCGYHNVEHFCRQFKKHTGDTPGNYRRKKIASL